MSGRGPSFSPEEERALAGVLDEIIPPSPDGSLPGAGQLDLCGWVAERAGELRPVIAQGLRALDERARERGAADFASLPATERTEVLNAFAATDPGFLPGLIFHTYIGYYQDGRVLEALGMEPRPPYPEGYELEPGDLGLLDAVRRRPQLYRKV